MIWLIVFGISLVVEFMVPGLISIWFALGSLVAYVTYLVHLPVGVQIACFIITSFAAILCSRPLAKKLQGKKSATNADRMIGQTGIVTTDIDPIENTGQVKVLGQIWSAASESGTPIAKDRLVTVLEIKGVKLIVKENSQN